MKLLTYERAGEHRLGIAVDDRVVDANRAAAALHRSRGVTNAQALADATVPAEIVAFLAGGAAALATAAEALDHVARLDPVEARRELLVAPASDVKLLPPVPQPPKIVCVARNYAKHAKEANLPVSEIPIIFPRFANTLVAHGAPVIRPSVSEQLDWEGELAFVIGAPGHRIGRDEAMRHVAGYSVFNDVTVRDFQFRVTQYTAGKNFRASAPFGPYLVTPDEVGDPHQLTVRTEVNGVVKQEASTDEFIFDIPTIIEHISEFVPLEVGDVIATGTPAGVGFKREPAEFLRPGDTVTVSVEGVGVLENPVIAEEELT
jgi:2-keto-4-pentenoate hydratase/2-oxohepta-3-ene-1,7-dioic acid hydratase in catechol pathway